MDTIVLPKIMQLRQMDVETSLIGLGIFAVLALLVAHATNSISFPGLGLSPYLKFVYANFIKPHTRKFDGGQQSALESFYAAQVGHSVSFRDTRQLRSARLASMTPPESAFCVVVKTCSLSWLPNSSPA
jgi:hypothetical protein